MSSTNLSKLDVVHHEGYDSGINSLYVPALKIPALGLIFVSGLTAAPVYHDHPHRPEDFADLPRGIAEQAELVYAHLGQALEAADSGPDRVVSLTRFFVDVEADQDAVNRIQGRFLGAHLPTSTSVEVRRLATHPALRLEVQAVAVV